jgi:ABC-type nitrate/sulfonate/bicarbonate transport system substrate-binding protein
MFNRRIRLVACLGTMVAILAAGAARAQSSSGTNGPAKEPVSVRLTWKYKGEHAPLFVAIEKGYYAAEGLDVHPAEGSGAETVVKLIASGAEKIGFGPATAVAEAVSNGLPVEAIAVYQPVTPFGIISFPDIPLKTPKDLEGKNLGLTVNETFANLLDPFLKLNDVDPDKVTRVVLDYSSRNTLFMTRKLDVMSTFLNVDVPLIEKKTGIKFNKLVIGDFGMKLLGDCFFVNKEYAQSHGDVLRKLLAGTARGYVEAQKDPAAAAAALAKHMTVGNDPEILETQLRETLVAIPLPADKPYGWQDRSSWQNNLEILKDADVIKTVYDVNRYFTNEYLDNARKPER